MDSTSKLSLQQERTNEKYIEPEHPEFYRRIEETSPLEDQLGLVYTDQPQAEPKISYHERDIHNLRLFTQRYILQKEMENFANQAQVQVTSGNVERLQTTGELAGIYENEMRESPSTSQVSRQIETSEMLFSEYTEPAMPDILKRDSFSMQNLIIGIQKTILHRIMDQTLQFGVFHHQRKRFFSGSFLNA